MIYLTFWGWNSVYRIIQQGSDSVFVILVFVPTGVSLWVSDSCLMSQIFLYQLGSLKLINRADVLIGLTYLGQPCLHESFRRLMKPLWCLNEGWNISQSAEIDFFFLTCFGEYFHSAVLKICSSTMNYGLKWKWVMMLLLFSAHRQGQVSWSSHLQIVCCCCCCCFYIP